jgi:hypothetical protein
MMTLACLAAAGTVMGLFFNIYALAASCLAMALVVLVAYCSIGVWPTVGSVVLGLVLLQVSYLVGLSASTLLHASRPATNPTSRI